MQVKDLYSKEQVKNVFCINIQLVFRYEATKYKGHNLIYNPDKPCYQICGFCYGSPLPIVIREYDPDETPFILMDVQEELLRLRKLCQEERQINRKLEDLMLQESENKNNSVIINLKNQIDEINRQVYSKREVCKVKNKKMIT